MSQFSDLMTNDVYQDLVNENGISEQIDSLLGNMPPDEVKHDPDAVPFLSKYALGTADVILSGIADAAATLPGIADAVATLPGIADAAAAVVPGPADAAVPSFLGMSHMSYPPPDQKLCDKEYPGPYNFEVLIMPDDQKTPWEFSSRLNKIFILIGKQMPIAFSVIDRPLGKSLFIRLTPTFSQPQHFQELVHRCVSHEHVKDPSNKDILPHVVQHIIRCHNPEAVYYGDKHTNNRLCIVFPLGIPQAGTDHVKEFFHFVCKNSCPQGMNRKPIQVIFTLEDDTGSVLGRRVLPVRICSCPKRDKEKEEKELDKRSNPVPRGKKRKFDCGNTSENTTIYRLQMSVVGKETRKKIIEYARQLIVTKIHDCTQKGEDTTPFDGNLIEIDHLLSNPLD